jgi:protein-tyrosine phosphatase
MLDYNWVNQRLAVGAGISNREDMEALCGAGITNIISMRTEVDDRKFRDGRSLLAVGCLWLPQADDGSPRDPRQILEGIEYALEALKIMGSKVYMHCATGTNRGPTQCYAILRAMGFDQSTTIRMIREARPQVNFHNVPSYIDSVNAVIGA